VDDDTANGDLVKYIQVVVLNLILMPICLKKDLSGLAHFNLFGILAILYLVILIIAQTPAYMNQDFYYEDIVWYRFDLNTASGFAIALFAYASHTNIFAIKLELKDPVVRRLDKIFFRAVFSEMLIYLCVAIAGYLSFLKKTPDVVINRDALPGSKDILMLIGQIAMVFNLITCIPLSINPCRREIYLSLLKREASNFEHFILTTFLVVLSAIIGTAYPKVIDAFSMLGGFLAVPIVIYYPGLLFVKLSRKKWYHPYKLFLVFMTTILCILGFGAAFISLFSLVGLLDVPKD
jgi:amino acid permease